jgi:hypothetical protein
MPYMVDQLPTRVGDYLIMLCGRLAWSNEAMLFRQWVASLTNDGK